MFGFIIAYDMAVIYDHKLTFDESCLLSKSPGAGIKEQKGLCQTSKKTLAYQVGAWF